MTNLTLEQRYRRKANIGHAEKSNRTYEERSRLHGYIAGKAVYYLTENEEKVSEFPEQYHYKTLKCLAESGVEMLELHTTLENECYVKKFVALCHYFNIKVIPYLLFEFPETIEKRMELFYNIIEQHKQYKFDGICHVWKDYKNSSSLLELEDFVAAIYTEIKKQSGIYIFRCEKDMEVVVKNLLCDFIWTTDEETGDCFAHALPFVKFPFLKPEWIENEECNPIYQQWREYLVLYAPMVKENSVVYLHLKDSDEIVSPIPEKVYISMFVNDEIYMVVSNLSNEKYELNLHGVWKRVESNISGQKFLIDIGDILLLIKNN